MLRVQHYRELAQVSRNFATMALNDDDRDALLTMARKYERLAAEREGRIAQSDGDTNKPAAEPQRKDDNLLNNGELSSSEMQQAGLGEDEGPK